MDHQVWSFPTRSHSPEIANNFRSYPKAHATYPWTIFLVMCESEISNHLRPRAAAARAASLFSCSWYMLSLPLYSSLPASKSILSLLTELVRLCAARLRDVFGDGDVLWSYPAAHSSLTYFPELVCPLSDSLQSPWLEEPVGRSL